MTATAINPGRRLALEVRDLVAAYRSTAKPDEIEAAWGLIDSLALVGDAHGNHAQVLQEAARLLGQIDRQADRREDPGRGQEAA